MKNMKARFLTILIFILAGIIVNAQDEKPELNLTLGYHSLNNNIPYLMVSTKFRAEKTFEIVKAAKVKLYMDEESDAGLIGEVVTNDNGIAKMVIPPKFKDTWNASPKHSFIAVSSETKAYAETRSEIEIAKSRIIIDTTLTEEGARAISVMVSEFDGSQWLPANEVEVKIGVQRLGSVLPISDEESYTTDSTGTVVAEYMRDSLPSTIGKNGIMLVAKVEDNDVYGNLSIEKQVPWGVLYRDFHDINKRTLWATRDRAPLWLLFMAISIIAGVWGVIIYLVFQIFKIKRMGSLSSASLKDKAEAMEKVQEY